MGAACFEWKQQKSACHHLSLFAGLSSLSSSTTSTIFFPRLLLVVPLQEQNRMVLPNQKGNTPSIASTNSCKLMLCIWWDKKDIVHWELLQRNVTAEIYRQQLRPLEILQYDKSRPHSANITKAATQEVGWEVIPHPPDSPNLIPPDFHLFRFLSNNNQGISFNDSIAH